jgi:hypothetical protein
MKGQFLGQRPNITSFLQFFIGGEALQTPRILNGKSTAALLNSQNNGKTPTTQIRFYFEFVRQEHGKKRSAFFQKEITILETMFCR